MDPYGKLLGIGKCVAVAGAGLAPLLGAAWWAGSTDTAHMFLGGLDSSNPFNWHVLFMVAAFTVLSAEMLMLRHNDNTLPGVIKRIFLKLLLFSFVCFGLIAVYSSKSAHANQGGAPKRHYQSLHSWLGLSFVCCALVYTCLCWTCPVYSTFTREMAYLILIFAVESGIAEKNIHLSCVCTYDPIVGHSKKSCSPDLPSGCELSNWIGISVALSSAIILYISRFSSLDLVQCSNNCGITARSDSESEMVPLMSGHPVSKSYATAEVATA